MFQSASKRVSTTTLASVLLAGTAASPAFAQRVIEEDESAPIRTSQDGDTTIVEEATLEVEGADPITFDSNNTVTIEEEATVISDDADNRVGVSIEPGTDFVFDNAGNVFVVEDFVAEDEDFNRIADGPIAEASNRYGIRFLPGDEARGTIRNSGEIYVEGLDSFGISIEEDFSGTIDNTGDVTVVGDGGLGLYTRSINGDLTLGGSITTVGEGAQTVLIDGDISGTFKIEGRITNAASFTNDDGVTLTLSRSDLRVSEPTLEITGNVDGGLEIAGRPFDLDPDVDDEDGDGVDDIDQNAGRISASSESPALLIGSEDDITFGIVEGRDSTASLVVDGTVTSSAVYSSFDSSAIVIGGQGGTVDLPGGIGVSGSITASTVDSTAVALLINEGVTAETLDNSGTIAATLSSSGEGSVTAVRDLSGTLTTVNNSGFINADGSNEDTTIALDLSNTTSDVTITQFLNDLDADTRAELEEDEDYDFENPAVFASISGDVLTSVGDDLLDIQTGTFFGDAFLSDGNDTVLLSDNARYTGDIFGGAGQLTVALSDDARFAGTIDPSGNAATVTIEDQAIFSGTFENAQDLDVFVNGGTLEAPEGEVVRFDDLFVGSDGILAVTIDDDEDTQSSVAVNTATFEDGALVSADVESISGVEGTYTVLTADSITGTPDLDFDGEVLPLIFTGGLTTTDTEITLDLRRKTPEELGLSQPQSQAYDSLLDAALETSLIEQSILEVEDVAELEQQLEGLLPDYTGGTFDFVTRASRQFARHLSDGKAFYDISPVGGWLEPIYFQGSKNTGESAAFSNDGWGISGGLERDFGFGYLGLGLGYATGTVTNTDRQEISSSVLELSGHWRMQSGPINAFARVSGISASFSSTRTFIGEIGESEIGFATLGEWDGLSASAAAGLSYNIEMSRTFSLRPKVSFDYYWLEEDGYQEEGSEEIDLLVEDRTSSAATGTASLAASYSFGPKTRDTTPLTFELEAGWRTILLDDLGETTASFVDADPFTLTPEALSDGWVSEARLKAGGLDYLWQLGIGAEQLQGDIDVSLRLSLTVAL